MEYLIRILGHLVQAFLNLDQDYGATFPTVRSVMWVMIAVALWYLIAKFVLVPGNGGKYLWQLVLIPTALMYSILPIVDYFKARGCALAELLFIPGVVSLVCLALAAIRLSRPRYRSHFVMGLDIAGRAAEVAAAANVAAKAAKVAANVAIDAAEHAARVAIAAQKAASDVAQTAAVVAADVAAEAADHAIIVAEVAHVAAKDVMQEDKK